MHRRRASAVVALTACFALACSRDIQTKEAVKQGVIEHLSQRKGLDLDLSAMQVEVASVNFRENEADAVISFVPKGGPAAAGMSVKYTLERRGSAWAVKGKAEQASPHGGASGSPSPHGAGPADRGAVPGGAVAPSGGVELPAGHPPIGGAKKN